MLCVDRVNYPDGQHWSVERLQRDRGMWRHVLDGFCLKTDSTEGQSCPLKGEFKPAYVLEKLCCCNGCLI